MASCPDITRMQEHFNTLTITQRRFLELFLEWTKRPRNVVVVVTGGPGTGKTYTVIKTLDLFECNQIRMAPTGRIAEKIGGKTIHATFKLKWSIGSVMHDLETKFADTSQEMSDLVEESNVLQDEFDLREPFPRVAVVDEVGMIPFWFTNQIVTFLIRQSREPVMIVLMGDKHQLKPVKSNENFFDNPILGDKLETHWIELTESKRFDPEYRDVVQKLCDYVDRRDGEGLLEFVRREFPIESIDGDILKKCNRVLAFKNTTVESFNSYYLKKMVKGNVIRLIRIKNRKVYSDDYVDVKSGCLVFVTQNTPSVRNGTPAIFNFYDQNDNYVQITLINDKQTVRLYRNFEGRFPLVVGFASTVHKFQGDTIDDPKIAISLDECKDMNLVYTALSRVKSKNQIVAIQL